MSIGSGSRADKYESVLKAVLTLFILFHLISFHLILVGISGIFSSFDKDEWTIIQLSKG
jgi:hypothetical protein